MTGPKARALDSTPPATARKTGRDFRDVVFARMLGQSSMSMVCSVFILRLRSFGSYMKVPANAPAAPKPLKALPTMKAVDVGAVAHKTEAAVKTDMDAMKSVFME